jgi:CBS domain containing-hemolysin-like protein
VLVDRKSWVGPRLLRFKENIDEPISAILTLNTISNTVGAAIAGAIALELFGSRGMAIFTACLTFLVLVLAEIIPKTIGATFWKSLAPVSAYLLTAMTFVTRPVFLPVKVVTGLISRQGPAASMSKGEILNFLRAGYFQGVIQSSEFRIMENLLQLDSVKVKEIMTPRTVVFWLPHDQGTEELARDRTPLTFSRIPLYNVQEDEVEGVVLRRDITNHMAEQGENVPLKTLGRKVEFIMEKTSVFKLLNLLISSKTHLAVVLSEYGDFVGIVTMEDAIETLLGQEIVDEYDPVVDMRTLAWKESVRRLKKLKH